MFECRAVQGCSNAARGTTAGMQEVEQRMEQLPRKPIAAGCIDAHDSMDGGGRAKQDARAEERPRF